VNITTYTTWSASDDMGYMVECRWYGSATINIFAGIPAEDGESILDAVEVDVFTIYGPDGQRPSLADVDQACRDYLIEAFHNYNN